MSDPPVGAFRAEASAAAEGAGPAAEEFEVFVERRPPGLLRRLITTCRHFLGMVFGGLWAYVRSVPKRRRRRSSRVAGTKKVSETKGCSPGSCFTIARHI